MMFRDAYKNDVDLIRPDEGVVNCILEKMQAESAKPASAFSFGRIPTARFAAAAAGFCILVTAAVVIPTLLRNADSFSSDDGLSNMAPVNMGHDSYDASDGLQAEAAAGGTAQRSVADNLTDEAYYAGDGGAPAGEPPALTRGMPTALEGEADFTDDDDDTMIEVTTETAAPAADAFPAAFNPEDSAFDMPPNPEDDDWSAFVNFDSYLGWPDANLWDNLEFKPGTTAPLPPTVFPEPEQFPAPIIAPEDDTIDIYEVPDITPIYSDDADDIVQDPGLPPFFDLAHFASRFLNTEHRIASVFRYLPVSDVVVVDLHHFDFSDIDTAPLYSMLSKHMSREADIFDGRYSLWSVGVIHLNIFTSEYNIFLYVIPTDELVLAVAGYSTMFIIELYDGEYDKISGFLETLE